MKKLTLTNGGAMSCLILMCLLLVQGCKKDLQQPFKENDPRTVTVVEAKEWIIKNKPSLNLGSNWDNPHFIDLGDGKPILKIRINESLENSTWVLRDLLFEKNQSGQIENTVYKVYVDSAYFSDKGDANLPGADKRDFINNRDFTGRVLLFTINNKVIKGREYLNGVLKYELYPLSQKLNGKILMGKPTQKPECNDPGDACATGGGSGIDLGTVNITASNPTVIFIFPSRGGDGAQSNPNGSTDPFPIGNSGGTNSNPDEPRGKGKNFGVNANCFNCQIKDEDFPALLNYIREAGLIVNTPYKSEVTLTDGTKCTGTITEIKNSEGTLVVAYFTPDTNSDKFKVGYSYSIGNNGVDGNQKLGTTYAIASGILAKPVYFGSPAKLYGTAGPVSYLPNYDYYYTDAEMLDLVNTMQDPVTGDGIEFYLIVRYKGSKIFNLGFESRSNEIEVGSYTLRPFYNKNGGISFYVAARLGGGGSKNGPEYLIKVDQLNNFRSKVNYYTAAANWFYANGTPSPSMIKYIAGPTFSDKFDGLLNLWGDALQSPEYWIYLIQCFSFEVSNPNTSVRGKLNNIKNGRNIELIKQVTKEVDINGKIAASGMTNKMAGEFFGWKSGYITKTFNDFTRAMLESAGWTKARLKAAAESYRAIANADPLNPSAGIRASQLEQLLKHFD